MLFLIQVKFTKWLLPLANPSHEVNLFLGRKNIQWLLLKKIKKDIFRDVTRGDPRVSPFMKQNFNRTKFIKSFTAWGRNIWHGWANQDVSHMYIHTHIYTYIHTHIYIHINTHTHTRMHSYICRVFKFFFLRCNHMEKKWTTFLWKIPI